MRRRPARAALALLAAALAGCGGAASGDAGEQPPIVVSAASSLAAAFEDYGHAFQSAEPRFSFAGSNELAAQIRRGARPDVYAAANPSLPEELYRDGLVERPVVFAANRLVIAVPAGSNGLGSIGDVARPGVELAIGAEGVPAGAYAREALARLPAAERERILANVRTTEPSVASIVGKLLQGAVDAGFVYATDVAATHGELEAVELPARLRPDAAYAAAVVRGGAHPRAARAFVRGLVDGSGAAALRRAGFEGKPR